MSSGEVAEFPLKPREILSALRDMVPRPPEVDEEERRLWDQIVNARLAMVGYTGPTLREDAPQPNGPTYRIEQAIADADAVIAARRKTFAPAAPPVVGERKLTGIPFVDEEP